MCEFVENPAAKTVKKPVRGWKVFRRSGNRYFGPFYGVRGPHYSISGWKPGEWFMAHDKPSMEDQTVGFNIFVFSNREGAERFARQQDGLYHSYVVVPVEYKGRIVYGDSESPDIGRGVRAEYCRIIPVSER